MDKLSLQGRTGNDVQRVEEVPIERLRFGLSPRTEPCDPKHVAALAEVLHNAPPVLVHAASLRVIDGVHRVLAARSIGRTTIPAVLFECDEIAAQIEAVRSNVAHGKPLSLAEREASAVRILELVPAWSDRLIAGVSGLSPTTVANLRIRATVGSDQSRVRMGRDGKARPVDPGAVRLRVAEVLNADPSASNRAISRLTGASQATVRDVRDRLSRGLSAELPVSGRKARRSQPESLPPDSGIRSILSPDFLAWFTHSAIDEHKWKIFVDNIPINRVYEIADASRRRSQAWRAFATALEDRARGHRRTSSER